MCGSRSRSKLNSKLLVYSIVVYFPCAGARLSADWAGCTQGCMHARPLLTTSLWQRRDSITEFCGRLISRTTQSRWVDRSIHGCCKSPTSISVSSMFLTSDLESRKAPHTSVQQAKQSSISGLIMLSHPNRYPSYTHLFTTYYPAYRVHTRSQMQRALSSQCTVSYSLSIHWHLSHFPAFHDCTN